MTNRKQLTILTAALLVFVMLFSVLFIVLEADHDCCGEDCAVCAQIRACEDLLRNLLTSTALVGAAWCLYALIRILADADRCPAAPRTLIVLKVKLSD